MIGYRDLMDTPIIGVALSSLSREFNTFRRSFSFAGWANWVKMFSEDPRFWRSVFVPFAYPSGCLVIQVVLGPRHRPAA